jgi:hypothetical protein
MTRIVTKPEDRPDIGNPACCRGRGCLMLLGVLMLVVGMVLAVPSVIAGGQIGLLVVAVLVLLVFFLLVIAGA